MGGQPERGGGKSGTCLHEENRASGMGIVVVHMRRTSKGQMTQLAPWRLGALFSSVSLSHCSSQEDDDKEMATMMVMTKERTSSQQAAVCKNRREREEGKASRKEPAFFACRLFGCSTLP